MMRYLRGKGSSDLLYDLIVWMAPGSVGKAIATVITLTLLIASVVLMVTVNYSKFGKWF